MISFIDFFQLIHGQLPFPWQTEVAERLVQGKHVDTVNVPTGCGKTAMIDAAVYNAAFGGPRRIFFIIDRRVVVDEAHTRAEKIRLEISGRSELKEIQERLGPIRVLRLRGGIHTDDDWIWYPEETVIVLSTVDQVGSRLLHRGYGVSPRMWPLHAGFVGNDAFYIVDEAHQSLPFTATVKTAIRNGANVRLVEMSATPRHTLGQGLELSDKDKKNPILKKRLTARKRTKMEVVRGGDEQFTNIAVAKALEVAGREQFIVAVVVNRVGMARRIWQELSRRKEPAVLLTGRIRPFDRDLLMANLFPQICTGRDRKDSRRLFLVATQTIEVGADIDFDALVTEAAPLSALRQRFGRLDRVGELRETQAWILAREKDVDPDTAIKAPVYGEDIHKTWKWLENVRDLNQQVDFGFEGMQRTLEKVPVPKETLIHCPALLPTHIDILAQTGPEALHVDPAPWLHGPKRASYDVNIIWRRDLPTERPEDWPEHIIYRPPLIQETLSVPLGAACDFLMGRDRTDIADTEGLGEAAEQSRQNIRPFLRWRGADDCQVLDQFLLRPGDTIIVPAEYGWCDHLGWAPRDQDLVKDVAEECALTSPTPFILRLVPSCTGWLNENEKPVLSTVRELKESLTVFDPEEGIDPEKVSQSWEQLRELLSNIEHPFLNRLGDHFDYVLLPDGGLVLRQRQMEDVEGALTCGRPVELERHLEGVANWVKRLAADHPELPSLISAAHFHDRGKSDPRFQAMLHGNILKAAEGPLLAKSGLRSRKAINAAWVASGLPRGFRHEMLSLSSIPEKDKFIQYLVAVHHGYGRPWFPLSVDQDQERESPKQDSALAALFARLKSEYGPWALAAVELVLRAADARCSMEEARGA